MKAFFILARVTVWTLLISSLMYWSWNPDTNDAHGFFLFWGWVFAMILVGGYEYSKVGHRTH